MQSAPRAYWKTRLDLRRVAFPLASLNYFFTYSIQQRVGRKLLNKMTLLTKLRIWKILGALVGITTTTTTTTFCWRWLVSSTGVTSDRRFPSALTECSAHRVCTDTEGGRVKTFFCVVIITEVLFLTPHLVTPSSNSLVAEQGHPRPIEGHRVLSKLCEYPRPKSPVSEADSCLISVKLKIPPPLLTRVARPLVGGSIISGPRTIQKPGLGTRVGILLLHGMTVAFLESHP